MALSKKETKLLLEREKLVFIATTMPNGDPHVVPIWFVLHGGKVYFETDDTTQKFKNILKNNRVCLCFGGADTVVAWGSVSWKRESEIEFNVRQLFYDKYKTMDDSYINDETYIFEFHQERDVSWHGDFADSP